MGKIDIILGLGVIICLLILLAFAKNGTEKEIGITIPLPAQIIYPTTDVEPINTALFVPYVKANKNVDLGVYNLTTTGMGQFSWVDKLESATPPATPPNNTLRLFAEDFKGFSFYKYLDDTGMLRQLVRDNIFVAKNDYGTQINQMTPVYDCGDSGNVPLICPAQANSTTTMPSIAITIEDIADGSFGRVMMVGLLENIDTSNWTAGQTLYISDNVTGGLTATAPITPNLTQEIGTVLVSGVGNGAIQIISRALTGDEYGTINSFKVQGEIIGEKLVGTYGNGSAYVCVWDNGTLFANDSICS